VAQHLLGWSLSYSCNPAGRRPFGSPEILLFDPLLEEGLRRADIVFKCHSLHPQVVPWIYLDIGAVRKGKCWYIESWITSWAKGAPMVSWKADRFDEAHSDHQFLNSSSTHLSSVWASDSFQLTIQKDCRLGSPPVAPLYVGLKKVCSVWSTTSLSSAKLMHDMIICWGNSRRTGQWVARYIALLRHKWW
jgi:hypothetical protein